MDSRTPSAVVLRNVSRTYGPVRALHDINLTIHQGKVHGLVGENGAGKSTLMKLLCGLEHPDTGSLEISGKPIQQRYWNPHLALAAGVAMIHQELNLIDELSIADNLFLSREISHLGWVDRAATRKQAAKWLEKLDFHIAPDTKVKQLSVAQKQMVEIAKALSCQAKILILDEPTAVLTAHEKNALFRQMRELKAAGVTLIYISHHLSEVIDLCDCVTVLRDGELVTTLDRGDIKSGHDGERQIASLMVGRVMEDYFPPRPRHTDRVMLELNDLRVVHQADTSPINLKIAAGEIVGLAGLVGAGRTELAESLVGLRSIAGGRVTIDGKPVVIRNPAQAMAHGLVYLSEDRRGAGLLLDMSIADNINLAALTHGRRGWLNRQAQLTVTQRHVDKLGIRISHPYAPVATLSGGNQQKVALAKWLEVNPKVLILDEPTRGVDIGAKKEIYQLIVQLAQQGMACLLISSEMNELLGLCHRIAVLRAGQLVANLSVGEATEEIILQHAAGIKQVGIQAIEGVGHQR